MRSKKLLAVFLVSAFVVATSATTYSATISGGRIVEDFSTHTYADFAASTGLWNIVDHVAQAAVVAGALSSRPVTFGDGSDGVLDSNTGYAFNTDTHPNGYNFVSVNITGGAITVTGRNPLVIRSLTTVTIAPTLAANGAGGTDGVPNGSTTATAGGASYTCRSDGGYGGNASVGPAASAGGAGQWKGADDPLATVSAIPGAPSTATLTDAGIAGNVGSRPSNGDLFDTTGLVCGAGGAGGGGHAFGAVYATGGAGGGGGGAIHIAAVGDINVTQAQAKGGTNGKGASDGNACSGAGSPGMGGAIWMQTTKAIAGGIPDITGGPIALGGVCTSAAGAGIAGTMRGDSSIGRPAGWSGTNYATASAAIGTSIVQSEAYDLNTLNASFPAAATVTTALNGGSGSVTVEFAGSSDGANFSSFTTDLTSLSGKGYRYVKFRAVIAVLAIGPSPTLSLVGFDYKDLGLENVEGNLTMGCGTISAFAGGAPRPPGGGTSALVSLGALLLAGYFALRRSSKPVAQSLKAI